MRKLLIASLGAASLLCLYFFVSKVRGPETSDTRTARSNPTESLPPSHQQYAALMQAELDKMPRPEEVEALDKFNRPDMFFIFDRMKRMNPVTGEVPANGYVKAYQYVQRTWGDAAMQRTNYALTWEERGPNNVGGRSRAAMWDPNDALGRAFFAGGVGGGLWYNSNVTSGATAWINVNPTFSNVAVTALDADPGNPQIMYYGTGEGWNNADAIRGAGVWKSVNGGMDWELLPATDTAFFYYVQKIEVTANGDVYVGTKNGLFRSQDGGITFDKVLGQGTGAGLDWITDIDIAGNGDIYVGISSSGVFKSEASLGPTQGDAGSWTRLSASFPAGYDRLEIAVGKSNSNYVYAVPEVGNGAGSIQRSTNGGQTWSTTPGQPAGGQDFTNGQAWYDLTLEVDPTDHNTVYVGGIDFFRSTNAGNNWTQLTAAYGGAQPYMHPDQHHAVVNPMNNSRVVFANDGGIYYSSNKGANPQARNNGYNVTQFYTLAVNPQRNSNVIIGGTQDNGSIMVNQPGIGAGIDLTGGDGGYCAIHWQNPDTMWTSYQYQSVLRSRNGGVTFQSITNPNLNNNNTLFINPLEIDGANPNVLFQASRALWRNSNAANGGGGNWSQVTDDMGGQITAIAPAKTPANRVYFAANGAVYRIPNVLFTNFAYVPDAVNPAGAGSGYINSIWVNPTDGDHIFVCYASFGVNRRVVECRNADQYQNATWKDLTGNLPDIPCNWVVQEPSNPNGLLVGTDIGVFRCADITQPEADIYWSPESNGLGLPRVDMIRVRPSDSTVFLGTHGRGFFSTNSYTQMPVANFGVTNTVACGGVVQFIDSTQNAPTGWLWDFGDGNTSTQQSPFHAYANSGQYNVKLVVTSPIGTDSMITSINVTVLPAAVAQAGPDVSGCPGDSLQLSATGGVSYSWFPTFGLDDPTSATPIAYVTGTRIYVVTVTDANGCTATDTLVVTQSVAPNVWAGQDQTITMPNDSAQLQGAGADTYVWSPATGLSCTNCPNPKAYPPVTTTYTVTGYNQAGCFRSDDVVVNVALVSTEDALEQALNLQAQPNPVVDRTRISFQLPAAADADLRLVDMRGRTMRVLLTGEQPAGEVALDMDAGALADGIYFIVLQTEGQRFSRKLVILKD